MCSNLCAFRTVKERSSFYPDCAQRDRREKIIFFYLSAAYKCWNTGLKYFTCWSTRPTRVSAGSDNYFHTSFFVRSYVRRKTSKSNKIHCRLGLWAGCVDHWWLLSCTTFAQVHSRTFVTLNRQERNEP